MRKYCIVLTSNIYLEAKRWFSFCIDYLNLEVNVKQMQQGVVAKKMDKGFGFIKIEGEEKDLFFHASELQDTSFDELNEGDAVQFEIVEGDKGPTATQVSKV